MTDSYICPRCGSESFHPKDIQYRYCGRCHGYTGTAQERELLDIIDDQGYIKLDALRTKNTKETPWKFATKSFARLARWLGRFLPASMR